MKRKLACGSTGATRRGPQSRPLGAPLIVLTLLSGLTLHFACGGGSGTPLPAIPAVQADTFPNSARPEVAKALQSLQADPEDAAANGRLGMLLQAYELFEGAKACFRRAQVFDPNEFRWPYCLGVVHQNVGEPEAAIQSWERALDLKKGAATYIRLGEVLLSLDRLEESSRSFEKALQLAPDAPFAYFGLGRILTAQGEPREAIGLLRKAVELAPVSGAAHYALAMAYRDSGDAESSRVYLALSETHRRSRPAIDDAVMREVESLRTDQHWHLNEGLRREKEGHIEQAVRHYEQAIRIDPEMVQPHVNLIAAYGRSERFDKAEAHYRRALELNPEIEELHANWGTLQALENRPKQAAESFRRALEINPLSANSHSDLGSSLNALGRGDEAVKHFRQALQYEPGHRLANFHIGRHLVTSGKIEEGITHLEKTLSIEDERTSGFLHALADAHVRAGRNDTAIDYAQQALAVAGAMGQTEMAALIRADLQALKAAR